jgi:hypothetical protein
VSRDVRAALGALRLFIALTALVVLAVALWRMATG